MVETAPADRYGLTGSLLADRYHVERQVGEGGFAVVYLAHQVALDRPVALKVLKTPPGLDGAEMAHFRERFAAEAKTIANLKHPHIVAVYDFGVSRMTSGEVAPWMALEWLDGETLETDLDRRRGAGGRTPAEAISLLRPVIEALAYAHRWGVVHRDIKPANMMSVATETGHVLRMLDFGIAKIMRAGQVEGTKRTGNSTSPAFSPHYASPEQVTFSRTGPWTDVHALGLVLTEILTDQPPFSDGADAHLFEQVMAASRPTPRAKGRDVGPLEKVIAKAVALSPGSRWKNAGELLEAIDVIRLDRSPPPRANRKPSGGTRTLTSSDVGASATRIARQNLAIAIAGGLAIVAALSLIVGTLTGTAATPSASEEMANALTTERAQRTSSHRSSSGRSAAAPLIAPISAPTAAALPLTTPPLELAATPPRSSRIPRTISEETITTTGKSEPQGTSDDLGGKSAAEGLDTCKMTINSVPWAEVWVDGRNSGSHTPLVDYAVPCGRHRIEFKRLDLAIDETESIVAVPGEAIKHRYTLTGMTK
jgi:serine/threonine protein kinase